jgi:hypothetical protein
VYVSADEIDRVNISFNNKRYFSSIGSQVELKSSFIESNLPPQVPLNDPFFEALISTAESIKNAGMTAGAVSAGMSFIMSASLSLIYGIINMVQMYVHYPIFKISFPGNLHGILTVFLEIA